MSYAVIATLGPGSAMASTWRALVAAGATGFRLNTSHLTVPQLHPWLARLDPVLASLTPRPPLVLDLQGSKWRLGKFPAFTLMPGQRVELVCADSTERPAVLPVPHPDFFQAAPLSSGTLVLNDAKVRLVMEGVDGQWMRARVTQGGELSARKGLTYTDSTYRHESLSAKDRQILVETSAFPGIQYAISYVRDAAELAHYREFVGNGVVLIAKVERRSALEEVAQIAAGANALWLCRGDLGAELGIAALAQAVHRFSAQVGELAMPVLLAGQVLEHMTLQATPTRSEVCYLYDALCAGYAGVVLSDETAVGEYPVESCRIAALFQASSVAARAGS